MRLPLFSTYVEPFLSARLRPNQLDTHRVSLLPNDEDRNRHIRDTFNLMIDLGQLKKYVDKGK